MRELLRGAHGRNLSATIETLNPLLRGLGDVLPAGRDKRVLEELDGWMRHKLRCLLWRQWKRPYARARNLMQRGLTEERAWRSAGNQRGPWWNAGASHMNAAFPKSWFDTSGAGVAARYGAAPPACFMNRRMRNRTYGGVGGRRG